VQILKGSEKQIKFADDIINTFDKMIDNIINTVKGKNDKLISTV
jgi:3-methyladenine DNA glycosylase AlkD